MIRKAIEGDVSLLQHVGRKTFYETFASANSEKDMVEYLENGFSESKILEELHDDESAFYLAYDGEIAMGYLKLNWGHAQTELSGESSALEIERIYVLQEFQGKQVGQALYAKAVEIAQQKRVHFIWLGVWEENSKAIRFYEKNGFVAFDKHISRLGRDEQTDIIMKKML